MRIARFLHMKKLLQSAILSTFACPRVNKCGGRGIIGT
jgi:hypothetical protein